MAAESAYDSFAPIYNKHWGSMFADAVLPVLDRLLLPGLPSDARILDVCCGTGQLARALAAKGYRVTGLDGSPEMIRFARQNAPGVEFVVGDVRTFSSPSVYSGAVSTFDSLNHLMGLDDLAAAFRNVRDALVPGGVFVFDLNMEEGYLARWRGSQAVLEENVVCVVRSSYEKEGRFGRVDIVTFRREADGRWRREDLALLQRCYSEEEVRSGLREAGFEAVRTFEGQRDFGLLGGVGRMFFCCRKPRGIRTPRPADVHPRSRAANRS